MAALAVSAADNGRRWMAQLTTALTMGWRKIATRFTGGTVSAAEAKAAERRRRKDIRRKHGV